MMSLPVATCSGSHIFLDKTCADGNAVVSTRSMAVRTAKLENELRNGSSPGNASVNSAAPSKRLGK